MKTIIVNIITVLCFSLAISMATAHTPAVDAAWATVETSGKNLLASISDMSSVNEDISRQEANAMAAKVHHALTTLEQDFNKFADIRDKEGK